MRTIRTVLQQAGQKLAQHHTSARLEAEVLLGYSLQMSRSHLLARPAQQLDTAQIARFEQLVQRRLHGEPIAYITGRREFWSLDLRVSPATLIPRPETELLVEQALRLIPLHQALRIADLGTGSGCIALAIARERPQCDIIAIDDSAAALEIARHNATQLDIRNVRFLHNNWLSDIGGPAFDLIVSNPPYIAEGDPHLQQGDLPFEPRQALVADSNGLDAIRQIAIQAGDCLNPDGWLLIEHGYDQRDEATALLRQQGYDSVRSHSDLAGIPRVLQAQHR